MGLSFLSLKLVLCNLYVFLLSGIKKNKVHRDICAVSIFYVTGALVPQGDGEGCRDTMYQN